MENEKTTKNEEETKIEIPVGMLGRPVVHTDQYVRTELATGKDIGNLLANAERVGYGPGAYTTVCDNTGLHSDTSIPAIYMDKISGEEENFTTWLYLQGNQGSIVQEHFLCKCSNFPFKIEEQIVT